jgi:hypothetical protein
MMRIPCLVTDDDGIDSEGLGQPAGADLRAALADDSDAALLAARCASVTALRRLREVALRDGAASQPERPGGDHDP